MVLPSDNQSTHPLPGTLQIGGIRLEHAPLIWLHPDNVRDFIRFELGARRGGAANAEATLRYLHLQSFVFMMLWKGCCAGVFTVRARRRSEGQLGAYEFIAADRIPKIWSHHFWTAVEGYEDLEFCGPAPPWIKVIAGEFQYPEYVLQEFQWVENYTLVCIRGIVFELGAAQAGVVRFLHEAVTDLQDWRYEKDIQQEVGCGRISDLFTRHANWTELIQKVGKGRYRLNVRSQNETSPVLPGRESY